MALWSAWMQTLTPYHENNLYNDCYCNYNYFNFRPHKKLPGWLLVQTSWDMMPCSSKLIRMLTDLCLVWTSLKDYIYKRQIETLIQVLHVSLEISWRSLNTPRAVSCLPSDKREKSLKISDKTVKHVNLYWCLLSCRRRSKEYLHGFWITTSSSCSHLVSQSSFFSSTEAKMRLVGYISFFPVFPHALLCKCNKSLCQREKETHTHTQDSLVYYLQLSWSFG